ncbi:ribonuclease Z [bacterium]|nr:ribonuclease Z [bacterium]
MEVISLGTSAALPTLYRWLSSIVVILKGEILLFDCGEGTQMQFQKAQLKPGKLSKIFISHLHGDHFYGLIGFLTSLQLSGRTSPMNIYGPVGLKRYLTFMQELSRFDFRYAVRFNEVEEESRSHVWDFEKYAVQARPLDHSIFVLGFRIEEKPRPGKFDVEAAERLGLEEGPLRGRLQRGESVTLPNGKNIAPAEVLGPPQEGKKLAICLDTRPCPNAVELARDVELLIHDGTFDQSRAEWADTTGHSTVQQAAKIARAACAKKLLLTHVSARYTDEDEHLLIKQAKSTFRNVQIAHDLKRIKV